MSDQPDELITLYSKKSLRQRWGKSHVVIDIPFDVFSSFQLDIGTMFLLRNMSKQGQHCDRALDMGCGYGTIGLYLGACSLARHVEGIDRDVLATTFAQHNAQQNGMSDIVFKAGLAYDDVSRRCYDLIASNVPAKVGDSVHRLMLLGASTYLSETGHVWIVVVRPLEANIERILGHESVELLAKIVRKGHIAYNYRFLAPVEPPSDPYSREVRAFAYRKYRWSLETVWGLPEFDTLSFDTELMLDLVPAAGGKGTRELLVHNPGQGHIPVALAQAFPGIECVKLRLRNLLALRSSEHSLRRAGFKGLIYQQLTIAPSLVEGHSSASLLIGRLEHDLGIELNYRMVTRWVDQMNGCPMIIGCRAALGRHLLQRFEKGRIQISDSAFRKGFCALRI